jgi:hypothetical protein
VSSGFDMCPSFMCRGLRVEFYVSSGCFMGVEWVFYVSSGVYVSSFMLVLCVECGFYVSSIMRYLCVECGVYVLWDTRIG